MIELGQHAQYIVGAWGSVALVTFGLIVWTVRDASIQKQRLADLEAKGIKRRSSKVSAA